MIYEGIFGPHEGFQTLKKEPSDFPGNMHVSCAPFRVGLIIHCALNSQGLIIITTVIRKYFAREIFRTLNFRIK